MKIKIIVVVLIVALFSCAPKDREPTILSDRICGKVCWNNITVGKSEKQEVLEIISKLPNVVQASVIIFDESDESLFDDNIVFQYYRIVGDKDSLINISARTKNQKVIYMVFQGDLGLTIKDVSDTFGEPDFVSSLWTFDGGINVHLINSLQGAEITAYFRGEKSSISPNTVVNHLVLFDTDLYQTFLESNLFNPDYKSFILYPWTGYGKIEDHYWPPR